MSDVTRFERVERYIDIGITLPNDIGQLRRLWNAVDQEAMSLGVDTAFDDYATVASDGESLVVTFRRRS